MAATADQKRYATDHRAFRDAVMQDGIHAAFEDSPISSRLEIRDICVYRDGVRRTDAELGSTTFDFANPDHYHVVPDLNKIDKIGRTSWDSFSYALLMGHNVWMHIEAVQRANREYDRGQAPDMMLHPNDANFDARKIIDRVFAACDRSKSLAIIDDHAKVWERIVGTRGYTGRRAVNAHSQFNVHFDFESDSEADPELDQAKLDTLEQSV